MRGKYINSFFIEKKGGNGPSRAQKLLMVIILDLHQGFFFKFCKIKEARRYIKITLTIFLT